MSQNTYINNRMMERGLDDISDVHDENVDPNEQCLAQKEPRVLHTSVKRPIAFNYRRGAKKAPIKKVLKRRDTKSFKFFIRKILTEVHEHTKISKSAIEIMNSIVLDILDQIIEDSLKLLTIGVKKTLTWKDVSTAAKLILPAGIASHACHEGIKARNKYMQNMDNNRNH